MHVSGIRALPCTALAVALALLSFGSSARAATAPLTFNIGAGSSFDGAVRGNLTLTVITGTGRVSMSVSSTLLFGLSGTGTLNMNVAAGQTVGLAVAESNNTFSVVPTGSFTVDAPDNKVDAIPGVLDGGAPGSDGKWDMDVTTGQFGASVLRDLSVAVPDIGLNIQPGGGAINGTVNGNISLSFITLGVTGNVALTLSQVINAGLFGLTIDQADPYDLDPTSITNFGNGSHQLGPTLPDLSEESFVLPEVDVAGTVGGEFLANGHATLNAGILGTIFNQQILTNESIGALAEAIDFNTLLPGLLELLHFDTANVDYDDVSAVLVAGTGDEFLPFDIDLDEQVIPFAFNVPNPGTGNPRAQANVEGSFTLKISGSLEVNLNALLQGDKLTNAVNVVPEPSSFVLCGLAALGIVPVVWRRRKQR